MVDRSEKSILRKRVLIRRHYTCVDCASNISRHDVLRQSVVVNPDLPPASRILDFEREDTVVK